MSMNEELKTLRGEPSWQLSSDSISVSVTRRGGMMAPVTFATESAAPIEPYYLSPWQEEGLEIADPVLGPLRGDFFCMPFGGDNRYRDEHHVAHGEPATQPWTYESSSHYGAEHSLQLSMKTKVRPGRIEKSLRLIDGHDAIYVEHRLSGYQGAMCLGHHATLRPAVNENGMLIRTSRPRLAMTAPREALATSGGEYYALAPLAEFSSLDRVPTIWSDQAYEDLGRFPRRHGFVDIAAVCQLPTDDPAWTTALFAEEGFLWFSLKDPRSLPTTVLWTENHGRHQSPWNGRNACIGLEDVCGYFAQGLTESSRRNAMNERGIPTAFELSPDRPTVIAYIQGAIAVPEGFRELKEVRFETDGVRFLSTEGPEATARVDWSFLEASSPISNN
jgi:hypothetical protein